MAKAFIWDLDDTWYVSPKDFYKELDLAGCRAAIKLGLDMDENQALVKSEEGYHKYGMGYRIFAEEYGIDMNQLKEAYYQTINIGFIEDLSDHKALLNSVDVKHAVLTHSESLWADTVLAKMGLSKCFDPDHIIGLEKTGGYKKNKSRKPFETALEALKCNAKDCVMIDDTSDNLHIPHEMGMRTVLVTNGKDVTWPQADVICNRPSAFLRAYNEQRFSW